MEHFIGGHKAVARPDPIPNSAVKHCIADGSGCIASARVGRRQFLSFTFPSPRSPFLPPRCFTNLSGLINHAGVSLYYHPRQIVELKEALGITLKSTKGLLRQNELKVALGGIDLDGTLVHPYPAHLCSPNDCL